MTTTATTMIVINVVLTYPPHISCLGRIITQNATSVTPNGRHTFFRQPDAAHRCSNLPNRVGNGWDGWPPCLAATDCEDRKITPAASLYLFASLETPPILDRQAGVTSRSRPVSTS